MWLAQCRTDGLEAATLAQYEQHTRLHILPLLGAIRLADLSSASVAEYCNAVITRQKRSRVLVAKVLTSLGAILATAQAAGLVARNVVRDGPAPPDRASAASRSAMTSASKPEPTADQGRAKGHSTGR